MPPIRVIGAEDVENDCQRRRDHVAGLTGLGVQDAAIAAIVADVVLRDGLGREL